MSFKSLITFFLISIESKSIKPGTRYFCIIKAMHMKAFSRLLFCVAVALVFVSGRNLHKREMMADQLTGSWMHQSGDEEHLLLFIDGYNTHSIYSKSAKKFLETRGGTYNIAGNKLTIS